MWAGFHLQDYEQEGGKQEEHLLPVHGIGGSSSVHLEDLEMVEDLTAVRDSGGRHVGERNC